MIRRAIFSILILLAFAGLIAAAFAVSVMPSEIYALAGRNPPAAARDMTLHLRSVDCDNVSYGRDGDSVLLAIMMVEQLANGPLWRLGKSIVLRLTLIVGADPPDWTYGPMMIRFSKFRALEGSDKLGILDTCTSLRVARQLLMMETGINLDNSEPIERKTVMRIAATYNGQRNAKTGSVEQHFSAMIYNELVYNIFQELRFKQAALQAKKKRLLDGVIE